MKLSLLAATCSAVLVLSGCGESSSHSQGDDFGTPEPVPETEFNRSDLLTSIVEQAIVPTYQQVLQASQQQVEHLDTYCRALSQQSDQVEQSLQQARDSWQQTMVHWQQAELMQIGPLLDNNNNLRNRIYSWPNISACAVDQDVMLSRQSDDYDIATRTPNRKGLDALEYLLFNEDLQHKCTVPGTEPEGWLSLSDQQRRQARCDYAEQVAGDVQSNVQALLNAWEGEEGYGTVLKTAGMPDSIFATAHDAVNDISDAMFYIDSVTKDAKLAVPLGLFANDCGTSPCAANVESRYAKQSITHIHNNLLGLQKLLLGGDPEQGVGFDDFLVDVGDVDTAETLKLELALALELITAFDSSLTEALEQDPEQVEALHGQVKKVTDSLKTDFINSLALELPATSAGDND